MGHKVNPHGFRLGITTEYDAEWYAKPKEYASFLRKDLELRRLLKKNLSQADISSIKIERRAGAVKAIVKVAKPGMIVGDKNDTIKTVEKRAIVALKAPINIVAQGVAKPELDSQLVANQVAQQLRQRGVSFRRVVKRAISAAKRAGAQGVKIMIAGRIGGAEIARDETTHQDSMPLHTLKAKIRYSKAIAETTYGIIGVKTWIYVNDSLGSVPDTVRKPDKGFEPRERKEFLRKTKKSIN